MTLKTLLILRHAKAKRNGWDDYERPLAKRGKRDAPRIGQLVEQIGLTPDLVVSSGAKRALQTARRAAKAAGYTGEVMITEALYFSGPDTHLDVLRRLPDDADVVMIVGHNPTFEELVETLTGVDVSLPTATLAEISLEIDSWMEIDEMTGVLKDVHCPPSEDHTGDA
ncbi:MAG: histidine phosphatase family protein [Anaerolineae bacterium]|nr:histidine phosphatase family protein [Anaerolineae bacterium]